MIKIFISFLAISLSTPLWAQLAFESQGQIVESSVVDVSGGEDVVFNLKLTSSQGGEKIYRRLNTSSEISILSENCFNKLFSPGEECDVSLNISPGQGQGSVSVKYEKAGLKYIKILKLKYSSNSGVVFSSLFGLSGGSLDFNPLSVGQDSKKRVGIINTGNQASEKIAKLSTLLPKELEIISDNCSGQLIAPSQACYFTIKLVGKNLYEGQYQHSLIIKGEGSGADYLTIPINYDFTGEFMETNSVKMYLAKMPPEMVSSCLNDVSVVDKSNCLLGLKNEDNIVFEDNFDGGLGEWQNWSDGSGVVSNDSNSLYVSTPSGGNCGRASRPISTIAGMKYRVSFDMVGTNVSNYYFSVYNNEPIHGVFDTTHWARSEVFSPANNGQRYALDFVASDSMEYLSFECSSSPSMGFTRIDNLKLETLDVLKREEDSLLLSSNLLCDGVKCVYSMEYSLDGFPIRLPISLKYNDTVVAMDDTLQEIPLSVLDTTIDQVVINQGKVYSLSVENNSLTDLADYIGIENSSENIEVVGGSCLSSKIGAEERCSILLKFNYNSVDPSGDNLSLNLKYGKNILPVSINIGKIVSTASQIELSVLEDLKPTIKAQPLIVKVKDEYGNYLSGQPVELKSSSDEISGVTNSQGELVVYYSYNKNYFLKEQDRAKTLEIGEDQIVEVLANGASLQKSAILTMRDCNEYLVIKADNVSGYKVIDEDGNGPLSSFEVYCDMDNAQGGWTRFLNYRDLKTSFNLQVDKYTYRSMPSDYYKINLSREQDYVLANNCQVGNTEFIVASDEIINKWITSFGSGLDTAETSQIFTTKSISGETIYYGHNLANSGIEFETLNFSRHVHTVPTDIWIYTQWGAIDGGGFYLGMGKNSAGSSYGSISTSNAIGSAWNYGQTICAQAKRAVALAPRSCDDILQRNGVVPSGLYWVDEDGEGDGPLSLVSCVFEDSLIYKPSSSPVEGEFYSSLLRNPLVDFNKSGDVVFGVERILFDDLKKVKEGEVLFKPLPEDRFDRIRFKGSWVKSVTSSGNRIRSTVIGDKVEIVFYGTGLNLLTMDDINSDLRVSIDNGPFSPNIFTSSSPILNGYYTPPQQITKVAHNLPQGIHTATIQLFSGQVNLFGVEVVNDAAEIILLGGSIDGEEILADSLDVQDIVASLPDGGRLVLKNKNGQIDIEEVANSPASGNLILNGTFDADVGNWVDQSSGGGLSWSGGSAILFNGGSTARMDQSIATVAGESYVLEIEIPFNDGGEIKVLADGVLLDQTPLGAKGEFKYYFEATSSLTTVRITLGAVTNRTAHIDNVSVKRFGAKAFEAPALGYEKQKYKFRDFQGGYANDFSGTYPSTNANLVYTLRDSSTTLMGHQVRVEDSTGVRTGGDGSFISFNFIGTGLEISASMSMSSNIEVVVDGIKIGNPYDGINSISTYRNIPIISGLEYGSHSVKIVRKSSDNINIKNFIVYGNPSNLSGDIIANINVHSQDSFIRRSANQGVLYGGSWNSLSVDNINFVNGYNIRTSSPGAYLEYTFFGDGLDWLTSWNMGSGYNLAIEIDGVSASLYDTSLSPANNGLSMVAGSVMGTALSSSPGKVMIRDLPLALHTVKIYFNGGLMYSDGFDIYSPVYNIAGVKKAEISFPKSCLEYYNKDNSLIDGFYKIKGKNGNVFEVYCDMSNGGWTLIANASVVSNSWNTQSGANFSENFNVASNIEFLSMKKAKVLLNNSVSVSTEMDYNILTNQWEGPGGVYLNNDSIVGNWTMNWVYNSVPAAIIGPANYGSWCNGNGILLFMNTTDGSFGTTPGVQAFQGGCNSAVNWKNNFNWQVLVK